jgi:eukaryotic-like serine/threonine-protein kinase
MIRLVCAQCERPLQVKPEVAGRRIYCPHCRHVNQVPVATVAVAAAPDAADQETLPPTAPPDAAATLPPASAASESATLPPRAEFTKAPPATLPPDAGQNGLSAGAADRGSSPAGYEILGELGRGGMGVVYKARQNKLQRTVALKMILGGGHASGADLERFRTEGESIARLQHPHIVQIYEVGEHNGLPYFSLEFCGGGSLEKKLAGTPLPPREAAALVERLAQAMQAAHEQKVIHRDLKPANVLLAEDGTPKITDFGLAKKLDEVGKTQTGSIMGTPSYMAPEQAGGKSKDLGPACDIYALGAVLYECLTGRPPFRAATPLDTVLQVVSDEPVPPTQLNAKVPRDLETICLKCLQKERGKRYASAANLADDLRRFQAGEAIQARPVGKVERTVKWVQRRPMIAALLAAVVLVTAVGVGAFGWAFGEALEARDDAITERNKTAEALIETEKARNQADADRKAARLAEKEAKARATAEAVAKDAARQAEKKAGDEARAARQAEQEAQQEKQRAEAEKKRAEEQLTRAEWLVYAGKLALAQSAFQEGNGGLALDYLDACQWNLRGWEHDHLWTRFNAKLTLLGHTGPVSSVAFSPDGKRIVTGSHDGTAKVWDAEQGQEVLTLKGHTSLVNSVAFSPDGKRIVTGSWDRTARVWDAEQGREVLTLKGHTGQVTSVAFSPDGKRIVTGSDDKTAKVWDLDKGREAKR